MTFDQWFRLSSLLLMGDGLLALWLAELLGTAEALLVGLVLILEDPEQSLQQPEEIERLEQDIRFVASLAAHLLRRDGEIELRHRGGPRSAFRGEGGLLELLEYLARYEPEAGEAIGPADAGESALDGGTTVTIWLGQGIAVISGPRSEGSGLLRVALPA